MVRTQDRDSRTFFAPFNRSLHTPTVAFAFRNSFITLARAVSMDSRLTISLRFLDSCAGDRLNPKGGSCCPWKVRSQTFNASDTSSGTLVPKARSSRPSRM